MVTCSITCCRLDPFKLHGQLVLHAEWSMITVTWCWMMIQLHAVWIHYMLHYMLPWSITCHYMFNGLQIMILQSVIFSHGCCHCGSWCNHPAGLTGAWQLLVLWLGRAVLGMCRMWLQNIPAILPSSKIEIARSKFIKLEHRADWGTTMEQSHTRYQSLVTLLLGDPDYEINLEICNC